MTSGRVSEYLGVSDFTLAGKRILSEQSEFIHFPAAPSKIRYA